MTNLTKRRYIVRLDLEGREIGQWILDENPLRIGRTPDNDIVIDNLAVSRHHAEIHEGAQGPVIRDTGSVNGLEVDGKSCSEASIEPGTQVKIGKHILHFEAEAGHAEAPAESDPELFDATIQATATPKIPNPAHLVEQTAEGEIRHPIDTTLFLMGKSDAADIRIEGLLVAEFHVEINVDGDEHHITHVDGRRRLRVNRTKVKHVQLKNGDEVELAGRSFRFESAR